MELVNRNDGIAINDCTAATVFKDNFVLFMASLTIIEILMLDIRLNNPDVFQSFSLKKP